MAPSNSSHRAIASFAYYVFDRGQFLRVTPTQKNGDNFRVTILVDELGFTNWMIAESEFTA